MTNVKVFADKQTDAQTNGRAKNICPRSIDAGGGHKKVWQSRKHRDRKRETFNRSKHCFPFCHDVMK